MKLTLIQRITAYSAAVALVAVVALATVVGAYFKLQANTAQAQALGVADKAASDVARGLGELVLTEGAKSSRELVAKSSKTLSDNLASIGSADEKTAAVQSAWTAIQGELGKIVALKGIGPTDDDSLILFGSLQSKLTALVHSLDELKAEADALSRTMLQQTFIGLSFALGLVVVFVVVSG